MTITREQFEQNLLESRLMSREEWEAFRQSLPADKRFAEAEALTRELVQAKRLTKYQAARIYQGKPRHLRLGDYDVLEYIASGGMGRVYKGRKRSLDKIVALKILHLNLIESESAVKRFRREVKVAARLEHPNIVLALDAGREADAHFLALEYVDGRNLAELLTIRGPMTVEQAADCIEQACRGLAYAHGRGIIHRDIKPANLMLDRTGCVKLLDLGLARLIDAPDDSTELTLQRERKVAGTFDYMSPEQAINSSTADQRSDIYSLGCTLYTLLTGRPPFSGDTPLEKIAAHRERPIPSLDAERGDVPRSLERLYRQMMAKRPGDRPGTADEVIEALRAVRSGREPAAAPAADEQDSALSLFFTDEQAAAVGINEAEPWRESPPERRTGERDRAWRGAPADHDSQQAAEPAAYQGPVIDMSLGTIILFGVCGVVAAAALALLMAVIFS